MVNVYCDYTSIYFLCIYSSCQLIVGVFARLMHSTTKFAMTVLSKCVIHARFVMVAWTPRGTPFQVGMQILDLIAEFTFFNLIISAIFQPLTRRSLFDSLPRCLALTFSLTDICLHSWKPRQHFLFSVMLKRQIPCHMHASWEERHRACFPGMVTFFWLLCARNSKVDDVSCPWADLTTEGLEPYHESCMMCECISSLTNPPWVLYFMCSFPSSGRLGPARAEIGLGFAVVGWFRRFRPPPSSAGLVPFPSASGFSFLALSGFARSGPGVFVLVFALSLFSCAPLFASWLSNFHPIFMLISLSLSFHLPRCCGECVCVCTICIDVKLHFSFYCRGVWHSCPTTRNEAVDMSETGNVAGFLYLQLYGDGYIYIYACVYIFIYIYRPWAHLSRSWGGHTFYRCWFIWSTSTVIIRLYIFMYICILSINCWCFCTSHAFHNQIRNDSSEQVCVCVITCDSVSKPNTE